MSQKNRPWFLRSWKIGEISYLPKKAFRELRRTVYESLDKKDVRSRNWQNMKDSVLEALAGLAEKHHCGYEYNSEGGNICIYKNKRPVFAIRIGHYHNQMKHLLKGEAMYRGIIDISRLGNVFYIPLPTLKAGKWTINEEHELLHVIGCLKEDGPLSQRGLACILGIHHRKAARLLWRGKKERLLDCKSGPRRSTQWSVA